MWTRYIKLKGVGDKCERDRRDKDIYAQIYEGEKTWKSVLLVLRFKINRFFKGTLKCNWLELFVRQIINVQLKNVLGEGLSNYFNIQHFAVHNSYLQVRKGCWNGRTTRQRSRWRPSGWTQIWLELHHTWNEVGSMSEAIQIGSRRLYRLRGIWIKAITPTPAV